MKRTLTNNTQKRTLTSVTEHTNDTRYRFEREHERCRPQHFIYARSCERSSGRLARGGGRCRLGEGEGGAGEGQEGSHKVEVVAGGSGGGVPVIKPAPVYNTKGEVVEVAQDVVDAVDRFTAPAGFVKKCASTDTRAGTGGSYRL